MTRPRGPLLQALPQRRLGVATNVGIVGPAMNKRVVNAVLCAIFLVLLLAIPLRNLLFVQAPVGERGDSFVTTSWILLCLFGALALVFGVRAIRGGGGKAA